MPYSQFEYIQAIYKADGKPWNIKDSYPWYIYAASFPIYIIYKYIFKGVI